MRDYCIILKTSGFMISPAEQLLDGIVQLCTTVEQWKERYSGAEHLGSTLVLIKCALRYQISPVSSLGLSVLICNILAYKAPSSLTFSVPFLILSSKMSFWETEEKDYYNTTAFP